jgi:hypothetical protein
MALAGAGRPEGLMRSWRKKRLQVGREGTWEQAWVKGVRLSWVRVGGREGDVPSRNYRMRREPSLEAVWEGEGGEMGGA